VFNVNGDNEIEGSKIQSIVRTIDF